MDTVAVLIPCYNESLTVEKVVTDWKNALPNAMLSIFAGLQLQNAVQKNKQDFELARIRANKELRCMLEQTREYVDV